MRDPTGKSRGFAFLTYEDPLSINGVFTRDHILDGKPVSNSFFEFNPNLLKYFKD